jgi:hypothetical protein
MRWLIALVLLAGCKRETDVELFVDGFEPKNVRFEVEDLGPQTKEQLLTLKKRPDVDGALLLPDGSCNGPCKASIITVFVHNHTEAEPPPVIRLKSPPNRAARLPIGFRGEEISKGRVGRIRWVVEMWPEEEKITATLSGSVKLVDPPPPPAPPPSPGVAP